MPARDSWAKEVRSSNRVSYNEPLIPPEYSEPTPVLNSKEEEVQPPKPEWNVSDEKEEFSGNTGNIAPNWGSSNEPTYASN